MSWPTHGPRGIYDWWTYFERGNADPFREAIRAMADVDEPLDEGGQTMLMLVLVKV